MATFVLVHGAWHGGWCWKSFLPYLTDAGHTVYTPTLTGLGERSHLLSKEIDLSCHVQDVVNVLKFEELEEVILVGHSYGGMVITGVAEKAADRLSNLVYLDAFVPLDGQSALDMMTSRSKVLESAGERSTQDNWRLPPLPAEAMGINDPQDAKWLESKLTPHPLGTTTEKVALTNPVAKRLPRTFISCTVDQAKLMPTVALMADRLQNDPEWSYHEIETGHNAMMTEPQELARILINLTIQNSER